MATPVSSGTARDPAATRPNLLPALQGVAALFSLMVLVQAFLAGRAWFIHYSLFDVHRDVGMAAVLVALVLAVLAYAVGRPLGGLGPLFVIDLVIFVLAIVQLGLGFSGKDSNAAAAWHVANGVFLFGLSTANLMLVFRPGRGAAL